MLRLGLLFIALVAIGTAVSFFLVPAQEELEHMRAESIALPERKAHYQKRVSEGVLLPVVVKPLVEIYLKEGQLPQALELQERFVKERPKDVEGHEKLAELYLMSGKVAEHTAVLEKLYELDPKASYLETLSGIYNFQKQYKKQADVLRKLNESDPNNVKYATDLAQILLLLQNYQEAETVVQPIAGKPGELPFETARILVFVRIKQGKTDEALKEAQNLMKRKLAPEEVADLASMFEPATTLKLIAASGHPPESHPRLAILYVRAERDQGNRDAAWSKMTFLMQYGALPDELLDLYVDEAMARNERAALKLVFRTKNPEKLESARLLNLLVFAGRGTDGLMEIVTGKLSPEYRKSDPAVDALIALSSGEEDIYAAMERAASVPLAHEKKIILAEEANARGNKDWVAYFVDHLRPYAEVPTALHQRLAYLFMAAEMEKEGASVFRQLKGPDAERGWALLAAKAGPEEAVRKWLAAAAPETLGEAFLRDIFYAASETKKPGLALDAANLLYALKGSNENKYTLASALFESGRFEESLGLLEELVEAEYEVGTLYMDVLYAASKKNPALKVKLVEQLKKNLETGDEKRQQQLVQALIESGAAADVLPYLENYAFRDKGNWIFLYEETLTKLGMQQELKDFHAQIAVEPSLSAKSRRRIAYELLKNDQRYEAEEALFLLAQNAKPDSQDVEQLMYLWGSRLEPDQIEWLAMRARQAPPAEQAGWITWLLVSGGEKTALEILEQQEKKDPVLYSEALSKAGSDAALSAHLNKQIAKESEPARLKQLARAAEGRSLSTEARAAYAKAATKDPADLETLMKLGVLSYETGKTQEAKAQLKHYIDKGGDAPRALFYLAEILRAEKSPEAAKYYDRAIDELQKPDTLSTSDRQVLITALYRMGRETEAGKEKKALYDAGLNIKQVKNDFAALLIDAKQYDAARIALRDAMTTPSYHQYTARVPSAGVVKLRTTTKPNELMIYYDRPVERAPSAERFMNEHPEWIESVTPGYDYLLLSGKPGFEFTYTVAPDGGLEIQLNPLRQYANAETKKDLIRYELLAARFERETGKESEARERLRKLNQQYPTDPLVTVSAASEELAAGNIRRAEKLTENLPRAEQATWVKENIATSRAPKLEGWGTWIDRQGRREYIAEAKGSIQVNNANRIGIEVASNTASVDDDIQMPDGTFEGDEKTRYRSEAYVEHEFENGVASKTSMYMNNDRTGVGQRFTKTSVLGKTEVSAEYQKPNWDFTEGVLADATRDSVGFMHRFVPKGKVSSFVGGSYNNYSVKTETGAAQSIKAVAGVRVPLPVLPKEWDEDTALSLGYTFDAEYRTYAKYGNNILGNDYLLYPLVTREVHFGDLLLSHDFSDAVGGNMFVGYAYDRLGGEGVGFGSRLYYREDVWKTGIGATHSISTTLTNSDESRINAFVERNF